MVFFAVRFGSISRLVRLMGYMNHDPHRTLGTAGLNRRRVVRHPVDRAAIITGLAKPELPVIVRDLSSVGCGLVANGGVLVGSFIDVILDQRIRTSGWVAWCQDGALGVDFDYPLAPAAVEQILLESGSITMR